MKDLFRIAIFPLYLVVVFLGSLSVGATCMFAQAADAGFINTVVGNGSHGFSGDGGPATSSQLDGPMGVAFDASGNLFIADYFNNRIRKVTPAGTISTVAGNGIQGYDGDGGSATSAQLNHPEGLAFDKAGNLYIADFNNSMIRKVTPAGTISSVAGKGTESGFSGDGGLATEASLFTPSDVKVDAEGSIYIADSYNHRIRKVSPAGIINTIAGTGTAGFSGDGGPATSAQLNYPWGIALDNEGNLYIADSNNHRIRKVSPAGIITTFAGTGTPGSNGDGGPAISAQLNYPPHVLLDVAGNLYIVEHQHRIRKVTPAGVISSIAGNGTQGFSGDGGPAVSAQLNHPNDVALDAGGNLYIADRDNNRIRKVEGVGSTNTDSSYFAQVAVGGGYTTIFTVGNTGFGTASGKLILTGQQGNALNMQAVIENPGNGPIISVGSSFPIQIPPGGVSFVTATAVNPDDPVQSGWGQVISSGGSLYGVATFQYVSSGTLQSVAGVLSSQPTQFATIPVDYDVDQGRFVGYAVANIGNESVDIKIGVVDPLGNVVDDSIILKLGAGCQIARFLHEDLPQTQFKGSMVFRGQNGASLVIVALIQNQNRLTSVPVRPERAPNLPE